MKNRNRLLKISAWIVLALCCVSTVLAEGEKERMLKRVPKIEALKDAGIIGETADGLLGFVKEAPAGKALADAENKARKALVDAENKDRKAVYEAIAKAQSVKAADVAKRRALQLAKQASSGDWLQDKAGKWSQKK